MKKTLSILLAAVLFSTFAIAQTTETVSVGAQYANQVWYSLENGVIKSEPQNNWDLAFAASGQGTAIRANNANGVQVWLYPQNDTSQFNSLDTVGLAASWTELINSDETWGVGALNADADPSDAFDQGWGNYSIITHQVAGNRIFVLKLANGDFKKLVVQSLISGTYNVKVSNLDNTNTKTYQISKTNYSSKNFGYLSIQNDELLDREPASASWDLVFGKYFRTLPSPYAVTGVKTNQDLQSARVENIDVNISTQEDAVFSDLINEIGYDWKEINMSTFQWELEEDLSYFVYDKAGNIWKLVFTGFGGSSNGDFVFTKEKVSSVSVGFEEELAVKIYPNPASRILNIAIDNQNIQTIGLSDLNGKTIYQKNPNANDYNLTQINVEGLSKGLYLLRFVNNENKVAIKKIVIQ